MVANLTGVRGGRDEREHQKSNSSNQFHIFSPKSLARLYVKQEIAKEAANQPDLLQAFGFKFGDGTHADEGRLA
jgi:hypothetical protein